MQSLQSLPDTRCGTNGRNPEDGKDFTILTMRKKITVKELEEILRRA
jgi:hypothetical protein